MCRSIGNRDHPIAFRREPKAPADLVLAIEFEPPLLFRSFGIALEIPGAIAEMIDRGQTIEPLELPRLVAG